MITAALTNEQIITQALAEYTPVVVGDAQISPDEKIKEIAALCKEVQISGPDDKDNYKLAKQYSLRLTKIRTGIESKRKDLKAVALEYGRAVDAEAKRLTALVEPIDRDMKAKLDVIDKAIEAAKRAEELRRHNLLIGNGWTFSGSWYMCGVFNITPQQLSEATPEKLDEWVGAGKAEIERQQAEAKRKADEDAKRQAEIAKLEALRKEAAEKANLPFENGKVGHANIADVVPSLKQPAEAAPVTSNTPHPDIFGENSDLNPANGGQTYVNKPTVNVPASDFDSGFELGFETCRTKVLEIFNDPTPRKRSEFIEAIKNLKA